MTETEHSMKMNLMAKVIDFCSLPCLFHKERLVV